MKTFKQYFEALELSKGKSYTRAAGDYKNFRNDIFSGNDRIILPNDVTLSGMEVDPATISSIAANLTFMGFGLRGKRLSKEQISDYKNGIAFPRKAPDYKDLRNLKWKPLDGSIWSDVADKMAKYPSYELDTKNPYKIGKILSSAIKFFEKYPGDPRAAYKDAYIDDFKKFIEDPVRKKGADKEIYKVVVSRHPYDIAGMSTDRSWTSCMKIGTGGVVYKKPQETGEKAIMIPDFIAQKGLIAYLVKANEINKESGKCTLRKPISRINLVPYKDKNGNIAYGVGKTYGLKVPQFRDVISDFVNNTLNSDIDTKSTYDLAPGVYKDMGTDIGFKSNTSSKFEDEDEDI